MNDLSADFNALLSQTALYEAQTGQRDLYGNPIYSPPVQVGCRWQQKFELVRDKTGTEVMASLVAFFAAASPANLKVDDRLTCGGQTYIIIAVADAPVTEGGQLLFRKVWGR